MSCLIQNIRNQNNLGPNDRYPRDRVASELTRTPTDNIDGAPYVEMLHAWQHRHKRAVTCSQLSNCDTCSNPALQCAACTSGQVLAADRMSCLS